MSVAGVGAIGYILKLTSHNNLVLVAHVSRSTKRGLIAFRIRPLLKRDSKDWLNKNVSIRATLPREVDRKDLIALYNKAVARFSKRNDVVTARAAGEQLELIDLYPKRHDSCLLDPKRVDELANLDVFGKNVSVRISRSLSQFVDYGMNLTEPGKPGVHVNVTQVKPSVTALKFTPQKLNNPSLRFEIGPTVSKQQLVSMYKAAIERFSEIDDTVTARAAGEVQVITNLRQQLPRSFDIGKLVFRLDSSGVDPNEYRSWMRYVATLDEEKQWRLRVYVYMDEPGQGHSIIHDEVYPLSYYVQLDVANRRTDVVEERVKHCSASNLIKQIAEDVKKTTKHCAEIIVDENMADKKSASEYTKLFKAAIQ